MNFCMNPTNVQRGQLLIGSLNCTKNSFIHQNDEQFQQNCVKLALPSMVTRSSSLTKITSSSSKNKEDKQKNLSSQQSGKKLTTKNQNSNEMTNQKSKKIKNSTKEIIFNKLLQKNQPLNHSISNLNNKQNHNQKQKSSIPLDLLYHKHKNVDKLIKLYQQKQQKELKQCTFNPKISAPTTERNCDSKEFFRNQIEHCQKISQKVDQMREMIKSQKEKQNTFRPKLSQQTKKLTQRRANHNVYDRLYNQSRQELGSQADYENQNYQINSFRRKGSKNSISLVSSTKKDSAISRSKQKNLKPNGQYVNNFLANGSTQLNSQRSVKKFQDMIQTKDQRSYIQNKKNQSSNYQYSQWTKPKDLIEKSNQNSQNKKKSIDYGFQNLDCKALFQQRKQTKTSIIRQRSCKLLQPNERIKSHEKKYAQQQLLRNKEGINLRNKTSQKTLKIALEKFIKQLLVVCTKLNFGSFIDFNQMIELMKKLNFIENLQEFYESPGDSEIKTKTFQIWTILDGTDSGRIILVNFLKIICAIQGFTNAQMIELVFKNVSQSLNINQIFNQRQMRSLILSEKDSKMIKKDFMNFYLTRFKLGQSKLYARQSSKNQYSFHPSISKQSQEYSEKYRQRIIEEGEILIQQGLIEFTVPQDGFIDHSTLLILDQKIKNYKLQQKRYEANQQRIRKQNQSMGSHSVSVSNRSINQTSLIQKNKKSVSKGEQQIDSYMFSRISHNQSQSRSKDQIFSDLYEQGRRSRSNRRDKSTEQVQYESNKAELTFKPKTNKGKVISQFGQMVKVHEKIPNFTKQVMRMRSKNPQKQQLSISPLLYLNVTMEGNSQSKIPVYQTDTFQEIVQKVRILMNIQNGNEEKQKLQYILKEQIIPVLDQLGIYEKQGRFFSGK